MEVVAPYFNNSLMQVVLILVVVDAVLGIVVSLVTGKFKLGKLAYFLHDSFLPYVVVFAVVEIISDTAFGWTWLAPVVFILVVATVVSNIFGNLAKIGLPTPAILEKD